MNTPLIVAGLGNHRAELLGTRHNAGHDAVDALRASLGLSWEEVPGGRACQVPASRAAELTPRNLPQGTAVILYAPTHIDLNHSGQGLALYLADQLPQGAYLLAVIDDMDLPVGQTRLRPRGSSGGHRGLGDIALVGGGDEVARLKIGIGRPQGVSVTEHVKGHASPEERARYIEAGLQALLGLASAQQQVSLWRPAASQPDIQQNDGGPT